MHYPFFPPLPEGLSRSQLDERQLRLQNAEVALICLYGRLGDPDPPIVEMLTNYVNGRHLSDAARAQCRQLLRDLGRTT